MKKVITYLIAIVTVVGMLTGTVWGQTYCSSGAAYSADSEIDYVGLIGDSDTISNNTAGVCAQYTDFSSLTPADLTIGSSYVLDVTAGTCGGDYDKGVIVYMDWNQDFDFDDAGEMIGYSGIISSTATFSLSFEVPYTALFGFTQMRIIVVETNNIASVSACSSYYYGETEDYQVVVSPISDLDGGISAILAPAGVVNEAASTPVDVVLNNFGGLWVMTSADIAYSLNGGTPVVTSWTGFIMPGEFDTITLPNITVPPGSNSLCAWTIYSGDTIPQNDSTCASFYGLPLLDAGVTAILNPVGVQSQNTFVAPEVTIENFGVNAITALDIVYKVNGGAPISFAWTGSLAPSTSENVVLPPFIVPGGFDTICAYTVLPMDGNASNDETCYDFYADPQFDFMAYEFLSPTAYCGMGMEDVTVSYINLGDTVTTFDLAYNYNGGAAVVETVNQSVLPGDTITYTFATQVDMSTTLYDILFSFNAWSVVPGDPVLNNDTIYADVVAMHIPENPAVEGDTVVYGTSAALIAFSIDTVNWFDVDTAGAPILATGNIFNTPVLLDTTTYWVQAATGALEQGSLTTSWADNNGSTGNMFDITAINELTIDSFEINGSSSSVMEVWYRPGSCFGFNTSNTGWILAGSYTVNAQGNGNPTSLPVGGITIPAGETYGICVTYVSGSIRYITGTGTNEHYANADMEFQAQYGGGYFNYTNYPRVFSGNIYYTAGVAGCASSHIPVTAIVTDIPTQDAGVVGLINPADGVELSSAETVTVQVYNYGLDEITNIPVSFSVNGTLVATETITDTIQPYDTLAYAFTATADLSAIQIHDIEACTSHPADIYSFNDCMSFQVECFPLQFCESYSTSTADQKIVNVSFSNLSNSSLPNGTDYYTDFTGLSPALLSPGMSYTISISSDFVVGYTYPYNCWVEVYIDWNHDGVFDETTDELAFSMPTTSQNTISGTVTVPPTAAIGTQTMRVVLEETTSAANVLPCGTYTWGETEDYLIEVMPLIQYDGGVVAFVTPGLVEVENMAIPVEVTVQNYGTDTLTAFDVAIEFNGGVAVLTPWSGSLAPGDIENIVLSQIVPMGAANSVCAYTIVSGDTNAGNDESCFQFATSPQFDAYLSELVAPENPGCGLGLEDITIRIKNLGDTINGNMLASFVIDGTTTISDVVTTTILPGDSLDFTFGTQFDFTAVGQTVVFDYVANLNLLGDPVQTNDTIAGSLESMLIPDPPTVFDAFVPYGNTATLTCSSYVSTYWYEVPAGGSFISADTFAVTPTLYDTLTYYVESSGGALGDFQIGTDNNITGIYEYPNPLGTYWWGNKEQFLIRAEELVALGIGAGPILSLSFNTITLAPNPMNMTNFYIKMGATNVADLNSWITTGLTEVYSNPSHTEVQGWNEHPFINPFMWDGMSNIVIETCFNNTAYSQGGQSLIEYSIVNFNASMVYRADASGVCSSSSTSTIEQTWRPNMIINAMGPGCPSARVPVTAFPTGIPDYDAGVTTILEPDVYGINMSATEPITVTINNWGQNTIANFPVSYHIDTITVTETVPVIMQSGDTYTYTFNQTADLSAYGFYDLCAWTGVLNDGWASNDSLCMVVENDSLHYCESYATSTNDMCIVDVSVGGWSNTSPPEATGYTNFNTVTPATLTMNNTYPISISSDFAPGSSWSYTGYVEVYIDFNRDNVFTEPDELVYDGLTSSQNTITGTIFIPNGSFIGEVGMRVVLEETNSGSNVEPCGTYSWGETEDYRVVLGPQIPYDAGVISILQPINNGMENYPSPVEVEVQNFGTEVLTSFDILYSVDGGIPVPYSWTGSLVPGAVDNYFLPNLILPGGYFDLCAYTQVVGDVNTFNDQSCQNLYAVPQYDAQILSIDGPAGGCDLGLENLTITFANIGDTIPVGNLDLAYGHATINAVVETYTDTVFPLDTITYTFSTPIDLSVTTSMEFEVFAWIDLMGDPIQTNDTTSADIFSGLTPDDPLVDDITIWSGTTGTLDVNNLDTSLVYNWYDVDTNSVFSGFSFNTPNLFDTTGYLVEATTSNLESGSLATTWVSGNGSSGNMFDITAYNTITIDSFDVNVDNGGLMEVWYKPGSYVGFISDQSAWILAGSYTVVGAGTNVPTRLPVGGIEIPAGETFGVYVTFVTASGINYTNGDGTNEIYSNADFMFQAGHGGGYFSVTYNPRVWNGNIYYTTGAVGCMSNLVPVTVNVEYADFDAAVWDVVAPTTGAYLSLVDVTAHVYNNGLNPISNFPIAYTWNGLLQATETITDTLQPGDDILFTFAQQLNVDTLWGQHTLCIYTALSNDGYTLNDESCSTFTNMDGDGINCFSGFQYGWVNDPPVLGVVDTAYTDEWWMVEAPGNVNNAYFSLCGSSFDTKLEVYTDCNSFYTYYNDDNNSVCGTGNNSHIDVAYLSAGTYYVRVFGFDNAIGNYILDIGGDMPCISVDGVVTDVSCNGMADGSIDLTIANVLGTTPFSYDWGGVLPPVEDQYNLAAGTYTVVVSDAASCQDSVTFEVAEPDAIDIVMVGTDATSFGGSDGAIDITVTGGASPYTFAWSNQHTTEDLSGVYAGYYTVTVFDANGCFTQASLLINSPLPPGIPNPPTTITHVIDIPQNAVVTLDGDPIAPGSLLLVYYDSLGTMVPGGFAYWSGMNTPLIAYGEDGINPGFTVGDVFDWKVYDAASLNYYSGMATYNTAYNDEEQFAVNGSSGIWQLEFLSIYTQMIHFPFGWSIFSTYLNPSNPDIEFLLDSIVGNVIIVKSGTGQVYWPAYFLNNIDSINIGEGYQIKTDSAHTIGFVGYPVVPELTPLDLRHGWSILGYLRMTPMDIAYIFSSQGFVNPPFTTVGIIEIAKDDEGNIYWPYYSGLNAIGDMEPGEGYQIKLNTPGGTGTTVSFTYPANAPATYSSSKTELLYPVKYESDLNTGNNMTIGIPATAWNKDPEIGDEIGIFDTKGNLVGAARYAGGHTAITVWGDDDQTETIDGAETNSALSLRYFHASSNTEQLIEVENWEIGNGRYAVNAISVVGKLSVALDNSYALLQNMPNPFNNLTEIRFILPEDADVNISVYNALGDLMEVVVARSFESGEHAVSFDASELPSGNYFYKMTANDFVGTKALNIVK